MNNRHLRFIFVQLLFSLAIGQVAIKVGDLFMEGFSFSEFHYIYSHLVLCVVILSTSWVGYQISTASENPLISVFSIEYIILLVDITLVICYFVIVRGAEMTNYAVNGVTKTMPPNILIETVWSLVIFSIYLIWDILTKVPEIAYEQSNNSFLKKTSFAFDKIADRGWPTIVCLVFSIIVVVSTHNTVLTPIKATIMDGALISLFFLFRGLKQNIKKEYHLGEEQISEKQKVMWNKTDNYPGSFPILIKEKRYLGKIAILKLLPLLCFIIFYVLFFYV